MIKVLTLAALLLVAPLASAQEAVVNRNKYTQVCESSGREAGNNQQVAATVCNCAAQYISYKKNLGNKFADFTVDLNDPLANQAVLLCVDFANKYPNEFIKIFSGLKVDVR